MATCLAGNYLPLGTVLKNLKEEEKRELCNLLKVTMQLAIPALLSVLRSRTDPAVENVALEVAKEFLMKEKNLRVTY